MTSINRVSPAGLAGLLTSINSTPGVPSVGEFEGCQLTAMILMDTNDLGSGSVWDNLVLLSDGGYTLAEFSSGTATVFYRKQVDFNAISITSGQVFFQINDPVWSLLPAGDGIPSHILYFIEKAGAASDASATPPPLTDRTPFVVVDADFTPDGTDFTAKQPTNGMFRVIT